MWIHSLAILVYYLKVCHSFYVPGVAPVEFSKGDQIEVKAVKMTSTHTQLPYEYYSLPLCLPKTNIQYKSENLGKLTSFLIKLFSVILYNEKSVIKNG